MTKEVRTRFAPSPTGHLHLGGARTALFNWLYARHNRGKFILRIEDTDRERSTEEMTDAILEALKWFGLDWDEGPFRQSERTDIYRKHIGQLLQNGKAYKCYCPPEVLDEKRKAAMKEGRKPKYDGTCRELVEQKDGPHTIRFLSPDSGLTYVDDSVKGAVEYKNAELDDLIIQRTDGSPTYNLVVVVDDIEMGITHIIRGDDHLNNTPRQIQLYEAFDREPPKFAHVPLILGADKARLSKRHAATSLIAYRDMGYLPEALLNYLVRLGWSHGDDEVFSKEELVELFDLPAVGISPGVFDMDKLKWLNHHYIKAAEPSRLAELLAPFFDKMELKVETGERLNKIVVNFQERSKTLEDMASLAAYNFRSEIEYDEKAAKKFFTLQAAEYLELVERGLKELSGSANEEVIEGIFKAVMDKTGVKMGKIAQPVRIALTGGTVSPGIYETIIDVGMEESISRIRKAVDYIKSGAG